MQNQRRWLPILILILIVLCLVLYFLARWKIPVIPGPRTRTPTPTKVREIPTPTPTLTPTFVPKPVWGPGNYVLVRRDDYRPATPLPRVFLPWLLTLMSSGIKSRLSEVRSTGLPSRRKSVRFPRSRSPWPMVAGYPARFG